MNPKTIAYLVVMNLHQTEIDNILLTFAHVQRESKCEYIQMLASSSIREHLEESIIHRKYMQDINTKVQ